MCAANHCVQRPRQNGPEDPSIGNDAVDGGAPGDRARQTRFTVLGLLGVTDGSESAVLQPSRPGALLAMLLLRANSAVSTELLQRVIWGDETPVQAKSALHSCVLRLRRLFTKYGVSGNLIEAVPGGYRLSADAQSLDLVEFRGLLTAGYSENDPEAELATLRRALALWQPPLLPNVPSDLLHRDEVPRLHEEWLRAIERTFDLELALGRHREVLSEVWSTARAHPLHERFTEQLMEALHRAGRRAEALAEYRRARQHLADQLGVDPGASLQRLELAILREDVAPPKFPAPAAPVAPVAAPPVRPALPGAVPRRSGPIGPGTPEQAGAPGPGPAEASGAGGVVRRTGAPSARPADPPGGVAVPRTLDAGTPGQIQDGGAQESRLPDAPAPGSWAVAPPRGGPPAGDPPEGRPDHPAELPLTGAHVLARLVDAGLLAEGPRGHYRMHELLRAFTRAAAAEGVGARTARAVRASGRTTHPPSRPGAADLYPTEA